MADSVANKKTKNNSSENATELKPALPELGTAPCPVCHRRVTVFVTKTKRPFINCGFCSARIFYNGLRSMRRLQRQLKGKPTQIKIKPGEMRQE
jgi:hypothetical protein